MKIVSLILTIFLSGYACGITVVNDASAEDVIICPSIQDKNSIKEKIMAFEPHRTCPQYDAELSFDENLRFCGRTKLRLHNI